MLLNEESKVVHTLRHLTFFVKNVCMPSNEYCAITVVEKGYVKITTTGEKDERLSIAGVPLRSIDGFETACGYKIIPPDIRRIRGAKDRMEMEITLRRSRGV